MVGFSTCVCKHQSDTQDQEADLFYVYRHWPGWFPKYQAQILGGPGFKWNKQAGSTEAEGLINWKLVLTTCITVSSHFWDTEATRTTTRTATWATKKLKCPGWGSFAVTHSLTWWGRCSCLDICLSLSVQTEGPLEQAGHSTSFNPQAAKLLEHTSGSEHTKGKQTLKASSKNTGPCWTTH